MNIKQIGKNRWEDTSSAISLALIEGTNLTELRAIVDTLVHLGLPSDHVHNIFFQDNGFGVIKVEPTGKFNLDSYKEETAFDIENGIADALSEFCRDRPTELVIYNLRWFNENDNPDHIFLENHGLEVRKDKLYVYERKDETYEWETILTFKNPKLGS